MSDHQSDKMENISHDKHNKSHDGNHDKEMNETSNHEHHKMKPETEDHESHENHKNHKNHHEMMVKDFRQRFIISLLLSIPVLILSPLIQEFLGYELVFNGLEFVLLALSTVIYVYGGWPFFTGFREELSKSKPGMMTLVALAISVSFIYSSAVVLVLSEGNFFFWELVTLIDIMLLGHWIEMRSVMGASKALKELAKLIPAEAHRVTGGVDGDITEDIPTEELQLEDIILIKPGEKVPTDGKIIKGNTSVNEAAITGESKSVSKTVDDNVIGGSVNGEESIRVKVEKTGQDTYLQQVMNLVEEDSKPDLEHRIWQTELHFI